MWAWLAFLLYSAGTEHVRAQSSFTPRPPRISPTLNDIVGLEEAKAALREAVQLPAGMDANVMQVFWRSSEYGAVLLAGPPGIGKTVVAEASASESGALVLQRTATDVLSRGFCRSVLHAVAAAEKPVVLIVESLDVAPEAALSIRQCLRAAAGREHAIGRLFVVAIMSRDLGAISKTALSQFGYVVRLGLPSDGERKQFLLALLGKISRVDPQWAGALPETAVSTLANITHAYTFSELELAVERAFVRSVNCEGTRDPVALHHFEQILAGMPAQAADAFAETGPQKTTAAPKGEAGRRKKAKGPSDDLFGPEAFHILLVTCAVVLFGIGAYLMSRSKHPLHSKDKRSGRGAESPSSMFGGFGSLFGFGGPAGADASDDDDRHDLGPSSLLGGLGSKHLLGAGGSGEGSSSSSSSRPTQRKTKAAPGTSSGSSSLPADGKKARETSGGSSGSSALPTAGKPKSMSPS